MMPMTQIDFPTASRVVPLDRIITSKDFRFRPLDLVHKADLAAIIKATGRPLDPITLWRNRGGEDGAAWIVLDGAHRLAAYRAAGWPHSIPALVVVCDRREALGVALRANSKLVLSMSLAERLDAAWRLVREQVEPRFKVREIAEWANVSGRTVDTMRARFRDMGARKVAITGEWDRDKRDVRMPSDEDGDYLTEEQIDAEVDQLAAEFRDLVDYRKHPGRAILRDAEAVERALVRALGERRLKAMIAYHFDLDVDEWEKLAEPRPDDEPDDADPGF